MPSLELLWNSLDKKADGPAFLRVDDVHPLDIYVGKDVLGERLLLLLTDEEPPAPGHYRALQVTKQPRHDGRWALTVKLLQPELARLFVHLCQDLVDSSAHLHVKRAAARFLIAQLDKWQRLMARGRDGILDESQTRGLFAELIYLERFAIPFRGARLALEGWVGPLEADQDFRLGDRLAEIKSCSPGANSVAISSADQLDVSGIPLFLVIVSLEAGRPGVSGAVSLNDLVGRIRAALENDNDAATMFEDRLGIAGYVVRPEYSERGYTVLNIRHYRVCDAFPRIVSSKLPPALTHVRYELSLSSCLPFEQASSVGE